MNKRLSKLPTLVAQLRVGLRSSASAAVLLALLAGVSPAHSDGMPPEAMLPPPVIAKPGVKLGEGGSAPVTSDVSSLSEADLLEKAVSLKPSTAETSAPAALSRSINDLASPANPREVAQEPDERAVTGYVPPERTVRVAISRRDLNRINCPVDVADVFYSKEKPVEVNVVGPDVFVKAQRKTINGEFDRTEIAEVVDVHIVCADSVYTLLLQPVDMDAVTLRLGDPLKSKLTGIAKEWGALPTEEKVQRLTRMVFRDELPPSFVRTPMTSDRRSPRIFRNLAIQGVNRITAPGLGFAALEYEIVASEPVRVDERDFLNIGLSKGIVGITVDPLVLDREHPKARLIIIERSISDGR